MTDIAWLEPTTAPRRVLTSAPGCLTCGTWRWPLIGPQRTIHVAAAPEDPFTLGVSMMWTTDFFLRTSATRLVQAGYDPREVAAAFSTEVAEPQTYIVHVRECLDCGNTWNESTD